MQLPHLLSSPTTLQQFTSTALPTYRGLLKHNSLSIKGPAMTFWQELNSWRSPKALPTSPIPELGSKAPSTPKLQIPPPTGKPTIITFLRHCGCPFAEKTFQNIRNAAGEHPDVSFVAVSHSSAASTEKWVISVGGEGDVTVLVDEERELYARWGLGVSGAWHVLSPSSMYSVLSLGRNEGIWNKPTESGSRWQTAGSFAVDAEGVVRWVKVAQLAGDLPEFGEVLEAL